MPPQLNEHLLQIMHSAIAACTPSRVLPEKVRRDGDKLWLGKDCLHLNEHRRIGALAIGKAAAAMLQSLEQILGPRLEPGLIITKYGHANGYAGPARFLEAGHPFPDENSLKSGAAALEYVKKFDHSDDLVFVLLSGGASALLEVPLVGISLEDLVALNQLLWRSGANIHEINLARTAFSQIKGGGLLRAILPARCVNLIISDVTGDRLSVIGSGPTVPVCENPLRPLAVLQKYAGPQDLPGHLILHLQRKAQATTPIDVVVPQPVSLMLANCRTLARAAAQKAEQLGYPVILLNTEFSGTLEEAAQQFFTAFQELRAQTQQPVALISAGEPVLAVPRDAGKGGRNQQLALYFSSRMKAAPGESWAFASVASDGTDAVDDAAGGVVDDLSLAQLTSLKFFAEDHLRRFDAHPALKVIGGLVRTGPTQTNVQDLQIFLAGGAQN